MSRAPWCDGPVHSLDFESTGVETATARIVTGTFLTVSINGVENSQSWLADPGIDIPEQASQVHGITTEHAREHGRPPAEVVREVMDRLATVWKAGEPVVIYNAPYDITLLYRELQRHLNQSPRDVGPIIDPLVLDKRLNKFVRGTGARKLVNTCGRYGIVLSDDEAHTSEGDTLAAARLAWKMASMAPICDMSLEELQVAQRDWYREQQTGFAKWLERNGKTEDAARVRAEAPHWPLRPAPAAEAGEPVPF